MVLRKREVQGSDFLSLNRGWMLRCTYNFSSGEAGVGAQVLSLQDGLTPSPTKDKRRK